MGKLLSLFVVLFSLFATIPAVFAAQHVCGYMRSSGEYVNNYYRSNPNSTQLDNYSTHGNTNPFTGQRGYRRARH